MHIKYLDSRIFVFNQFSYIIKIYDNHDLVKQKEMPFPHKLLNQYYRISRAKVLVQDQEANFENNLFKEGSAGASAEESETLSFVASLSSDHDEACNGFFGVSSANSFVGTL